MVARGAKADIIYVKAAVLTGLAAKQGNQFLAFRRNIQRYFDRLNPMSSLLIGRACEQG